MKAKSKYDIADADKTKSQNKLLNNKTVMSKLNKTQQKALKAGKTVSTKGITDPKVLKWIQDYNEKVKKSADLSKKLRIEQEALDKATSEAAQSQAEYAQSIVENAKKKLENIANYYDSFTSQWENRNSMYEAYMDRMQTQGYNLSTKFYEAEIGQQQKIVDNLSQKYIAMKRNFAQAVQDGTIVEGTEEYYEMQNEIDQVAISLKEAQNKVVEFQASIRDLKWEQFDQLQEAIGRITSESDFLIDLMSHKDMYDKDGKMTEQGLATMGLHGVNYNTYMAQADKYKEEMLKISEELANDPNNQKLIDRKNELIDAQQQAILSAENEKDSIKDLIQDGIDKQLDALDDLIDKYLDCLESEKSLYEYRKKIGEQSEKIASLQKQLSSLQGDNSEENKAKLQKLKEDLKSAQDDMEETQYDKYISDQKKLLDELKQDYKKALDDRMDNVDVLISDAIASINSNSSNISQTLQTESKNVGYTLSGEMQTIWTSQSQALSLYDGKFETRFTGITTAIGNVYDRQKDMIDAINAMAEKWIAKADQMLQQPTKTEGVLEEVEQKPDKDNVAEGNPTPDPPKVSDKDSIKDAVLVDPDEPKKKPNKNDNKKMGNGKAEVGDKVTFSSGRYYEASDGSGASGNMYLGKKVKITRINKGSKYPYAIDATDGTELGWVKLNQLKGYASGIMRVPNDQLAWTQEQGEEAIVRNDGSILTPLSRDVSVLNADMTKNLWDFMGNPGSFLSDYSDGEKFGVKNVDNSSTGIVTKVEGDKFYTIEGNTNNGSTIIANGGSVCSKSYNNSNLPGTKFCRPDYSIVKSIMNSSSTSKPSTSTYKKWVGAATKDGTDVFANPTGTSKLSTYPKLNKDNLVDVIGVSGTRYQVKIADKFVGYVEKTNIKDPNAVVTKPSASTSKPKYPFVGEVTASELNVRTGAGTNYGKLSSYPILKRGNLVDVLKAKKDTSGNKWYQVRIAGKYTGYVSAQYIKKK